MTYPYCCSCWPRRTKGMKGALRGPPFSFLFGWCGQLNSKQTIFCFGSALYFIYDWMSYLYAQGLVLSCPTHPTPPHNTTLTLKRTISETIIYQNFVNFWEIIAFSFEASLSSASRKRGISSQDVGSTVGGANPNSSTSCTVYVHNNFACW